MTSEVAGAAASLHRRLVLVDARDPTFLLYRETGEEKPEYWDTLAASGLTAVNVDVPNVEDGFREAALNFASWHERVAAHPNGLIVRSVRDIELAKRSGKVGFILSSQSPTPIENDLRLLRALHAMGLRVLEVAYKRRNLLADGCWESNDGGLSSFGLSAVTEMNRMGVAVDLSHASDRTVIETIEASSTPVFFSHSNARAVVDNPRNVPDEYLKVLAGRGGVCCVSAYSSFLKQDGAASGTGIDDYINMIRYMVDLIGVEHVGVGLDVGEARTDREVALIGGGRAETRYVAELRSRTGMINVTEGLLVAGFSEEDIGLIMGGNLVRFFGQVWCDE